MEDLFYTDDIAAASEYFGIQFDSEDDFRWWLEDTLYPWCDLAEDSVFYWVTTDDAMVVRGTLDEYFEDDRVR